MPRASDPLSPREVIAGLFVGLVVTVIGGVAVHRLTREQPAGALDELGSGGPTGASDKNAAPARVGPFGPNLELEMNQALAGRTGYRYRVQTDADSGLYKYDLENFVYPQRKKFNFYPYVAIGDFDGDGVSDLAATVRNIENNQVRLAVLWGRSRALSYYDGQLCNAIRFIPANELRSHWEKLSLPLAADAILVECYEKSAWVLYWTGRAFERYWVSD